MQNKFGEIRLGPFAGRLKANENFGLFPFAPDYSLTQVGYDISAIYDQIDSPRFPRDGLLATLHSFGTVGGWGSGDDYNKSELMVMGAKSFGKHALQLAGYVGGTGYGKLPPYDPFLLGGFLRGSGYQMDELVGSRVGLARAVYSYRLASLPSVLGRGYLCRRVAGGDTGIDRHRVGWRRQAPSFGEPLPWCRYLPRTGLPRLGSGLQRRRIGNPVFHARHALSGPDPRSLEDAKCLQMR